MRGERNPTSRRAIQVKKWRKVISGEEKLGEISWLEQSERIVDKWRNVRFTHSRVVFLNLCEPAAR